METKTFELRDEFHRKPIAEKLIRLLSSDIDLSPMVIDGGWGTGKTEFCEKLIALMKQQHADSYHLVYLDAFRSDHSGEPLLALLAQIIKDCTPEDQANGEPSAERKQLTRKLAKTAGFSFKVIAKAAVGHFLKQSVEEIAEGWQQAIADEEGRGAVVETVSDAMVELSDKAIDSTVEVLLKEQIEAEKNLATLRECLSEFAENKPIILFIDELDRCRPDYAVDMLETIKHVFDVKNVKVILITNTQQLRAAINHRYGLAVDSQRYLDKFLKYSFALPDRSLELYRDDQVLASVKYFSTLLKEKIIFENTGLDEKKQENAISFAQSLIERNELSLREVETFVRYLEIYQHLSKGLDLSTTNYGVLLLRIVGVLIFCSNPEISTSIMKGKTNAEQVTRVFGFSAVPDIRHRYSHVDVIGVLLAWDSAFNNESFFLSEEEASYWLEEKRRLFYGMWQLPNLFVLIGKVIRTLQFEQN